MWPIGVMSCKYTKHIWKIDIFLTTWHHFDILTQTYNLNHLNPSQSWLDLSNVSNCQKDVKCQKVKHMDCGGSQKYIDIMRFTHTNISCDVKYDGDQKPSKCAKKVFWPILVTFIFDVKIDVNMCEPHYVD